MKLLRFRRYNKDAKPSNLYNEHADLLGGYETYEDYYTHVKSIVLTNEGKYSQTDVEDVEIYEAGPPEHLRSRIAPSTEESRSQSLAEGSESLTEVSQQHLQDNANMLTSATTASLHVRFKSTATKQEIPAD